MQYKAIIFDLDGTAIANEQYAKPSERLIKVVQQAQKSAYVSAATGRIWSTAKWVIEPLRLTDPCIIAAGAQIIHPISEEILWQKVIPRETVEKIVAVAKKYPYEITTASQLKTYPPQKELVLQDEAIMYIAEVPIPKPDELLPKLYEIPGIVIHQAVGYGEGTVTLDITHKEATKQHALQQLIQMEGLKKEEVIGVGDSNNDLPLFEAVGYKIAMGNATAKLKDAADEIAESVEKDGLAQVIEKYILKNQVCN